MVDQGEYVSAAVGIDCTISDSSALSSKGGIKHAKTQSDNAQISENEQSVLDDVNIKDTSDIKGGGLMSEIHSSNSNIQAASVVSDNNIVQFSTQTQNQTPKGSHFDIGVLTPSSKGNTAIASEADTTVDVPDEGSSVSDSELFEIPDIIDDFPDS